MRLIYSSNAIRVSFSLLKKLLLLWLFFCQYSYFCHLKTIPTQFKYMKYSYHFTQTQSLYKRTVYIKIVSLSADNYP